jgi:hypothetical protein
VARDGRIDGSKDGSDGEMRMNNWIDG